MATLISECLLSTAHSLIMAFDHANRPTAAQTTMPPSAGTTEPTEASMRRRLDPRIAEVAVGLGKLSLSQIGLIIAPDLTIYPFNASKDNAGSRVDPESKVNARGKNRAEDKVGSESKKGIEEDQHSSSVGPLLHPEETTFAVTSEESTEPGAAEDGPGVELTMHPSFTDGDAVLISSDNVGFAFSLSLLADHSPIFEDMLELPPAVNSSNHIPLSNACAATMESLLSCLDPSRRVVGVPTIAALDELVGLADAFDFSLSTLNPAVYDSQINAGIKHGFASAFDPARAEEWALECLDTLVWKDCLAWSMHPAAHEELRSLYSKWREAHHKFIDNFVAERVDSNNNFAWCCGRRRKCETYEAYDGKWKKLEDDAARTIALLVMDSPKTGKDGILPACSEMISCRTCAARMAMHGHTTWNDLVQKGVWKL